MTRFVPACVVLPLKHLLLLWCRLLDPRTALWELPGHQRWPLAQQLGDPFLLRDGQGPHSGRLGEEPRSLTDAAGI